ncbi:MAG: hypothetical protein ABJD97_05630, partial [Betaproteobacteria bacterium]
MSGKPKKAVQYSAAATRACETLLVMLLRQFGPYRNSLRLIGGLVPRYLAPEAPPEVPAHVGSNDVDVVLDMAAMGDGDALRELKRKLLETGFSPSQNGNGGESRWQWEHELAGTWMRVDFLVHVDDPAGFRVLQLGDGTLSAGGVPFAAMVNDWYLEQS